VGGLGHSLLMNTSLDCNHAPRAKTPTGKTQFTKKRRGHRLATRNQEKADY
jgi:hypothetical protein